MDLKIIKVIKLLQHLDKVEILKNNSDPIKDEKISPSITILFPI